MERKRMKIHDPDFDNVSTCSTDSHTLSLWSSDSETLFNDDDPLLPRRALALLSLPIEIRFRIYQYAFSSSPRWDELVRITVDRNFPSHRPQTIFKPTAPEIKLKYTREPTLHLPAALLRTCHQIYSEALPVLFSGVCFGFATNPTSLMFLFDRFSEAARNSVRYLRLYPAPLYVSNGPTGEQFSWAVLCAQLARLPSLRRLSVLYTRVEDLKENRVEFQRSRYGKPLSRISAQMEPEFEGPDPTAAELEKCHDQFMKVVGPTLMGTEI
ncbi:hypothetical protein BJY01DRAFT_243433 [Aspergillus pseudoustus]|uniref:DUF7730 domain-containing protein n=1 Tax=Aspergillus pseudoustus TaxID=1810923 RepID=A0ABR4KRT2_9EURO